MDIKEVEVPGHNFGGEIVVVIFCAFCNCKSGRKHVDLIVIEFSFHDFVFIVLKWVSIALHY